MLSLHWFLPIVFVIALVAVFLGCPIPSLVLYLLFWGHLVYITLFAFDEE